MLDIKNGDLLVAGASEYPIRSRAFYPNSQGVAGMMFSDAYIPCSTKRARVDGSGDEIKLDPSLGLTCTPLWPADPQKTATVVLDTPVTLLQTYLPDTDGFFELLVEELQR